MIQHCLPKQIQKMIGKGSNDREERALHLSHVLLSLSDLGGETRLDGGDGSSGAAVVAGDEVQAVLALVKFGVG